MDTDKKTLGQIILMVCKQNWLIIVLVIILFFVNNFLLGVYAVRFTNKSGTLVTNLNNALKNLFNTVSLTKNPEYTQQLLDYSDASNPVTKSESGFLLRDFYIAGSSKTCVVKFIYNDYLSIDMIKTVLTNGSRCLEFDIFSSSACANGTPVVATANTRQSYLYTQIASFNYLEFNDVCQQVIQYGFTKNPTDPLFIILNLHLNKRPQVVREHIANQMASIIRKNFKSRLLGVDYSYQRTVIGNVPIEELFGKIIILCSSGFQGSNLDELVNYSWNGRSLIARDSKAPMSFYHMTSQQLKDLGSGGTDELKILNKKSMTLVIPSYTNKLPNNYNVDLAFQLGCNFICINYNLGKTINQNFINKFKTYSLVLKPRALRFIPPTITFNTFQNPQFSQVPRQIQANDPQFAAGLHI